MKKKDYIFEYYLCTFVLCLTILRAMVFFRIHFCKQQQTVVAAQILWVEGKYCDLGLGSTIY
jgi:hypothetical protein